MPTHERPRKYHSPRRKEHAAETRRAIVAAARLLFARDGYVATSLERIAREAGVSLPTVYVTMRNKVALLEALNDLVDQEGGVGQAMGVMHVERDPRRLVALAVRITRTLNERCGDLVRILFSAAQADPTAAPVWNEGMRRHRMGVEYTARLLAGLGALRAGLTEPRAADLLDYYTRPTTWTTLVADLGWTFDEAEAWLAEQATAGVLAPRRQVSRRRGART